MSRINENNCWASVQVVNKEPQTLLSPTTKRCWHKKNSIFLCRNHLLNSLVLNRTPCLLPVHFTHALETNHSIKVELKKSYCNIRCFLTHTVSSFTCDISLRSCRKWQSLKIECDGSPPSQNHVLLWSWGQMPGQVTIFILGWTADSLLFVGLWCVQKHLSVPDG